MKPHCEVTAAVCRPCFKEGCAACPHGPPHAPGYFYNRTWLWGTISVLSKDKWPYVWNATLKRTLSKRALILNNLLPEVLKSSYIKTWYEDWHVLFLLHD